MFSILPLLFFAINFIQADANSLNREDAEAFTYSSASSYSSAYSKSQSTASSFTSRNDNGKVISNSPDTCNNNGTLSCGANEEVDECPSSCPSDFCPTRDGEDQRCPNPNPCPAPACKCKLNYRRATNGKCILANECPPFPCFKPNEEYNPCPPYCPTDSCNMATPSGECPLSGKVNNQRGCRPRCRCIKGYWRLNDICVPYNQCPGVTTKQQN